MSSFSIPLTREQLEHARAKIADQQGIALVGDEGQVEAHGCKIAFGYNGTDTLVVTVEHKPLLATQSMIESKIREWFKTA